MKLRWKILLAAVAVCVIAVVFLMPSGSYRRAAEAYKRELKAKGEKITVAELVGPRLTTNMSRGAQLFMALTNLALSPTNLPSRMPMVDPKHAGFGFTNVTAEQLKDYDANVKRMVDLRAALDAGAFDFNLDYSLGPELGLPHLARMKLAELVAAATTMLALRKQDHAEVWLDVLAMADIVQRLHNERLVISGLVQVADANIAIPATWEALESHVWSDDQLQQLQARWSGINLVTNSESALAMEMATGSATFKMARASYGNVAWMFVADGPLIDSDTGLKSKVSGWIEKYPRFWAWRSTWSFDEEIFYLETIQAAKESARRIIKAESVQPALGELPAELAKIAAGHPRTTNHFKIYSTDFGAVFSKYLSKMAAGETFRRLLVTAIALKRYQLAHGAYPARLDELVPDYLPKLPMDFMDGMSLRYRLQPDGDYLLYSVGDDGKDDGGNADRIWQRPVNAPAR